MMIATALQLDHTACKALKITDAYSIHRVVYDLFNDVRTEAQKIASQESGISYVDAGGSHLGRRILILSDRAPNSPEYGVIESREIPATYLDASYFKFEVVISPTKRNKQSRKLIPVRGREDISKWFVGRTDKNWGFTVSETSMQVADVSVIEFSKGNRNVTITQAKITGTLTVTDKEKFNQSFKRGIGRDRAFGSGLLQITPIANTLF